MKLRDFIAQLAKLPQDIEVLSSGPEFEEKGLEPAWVEFYDFDGPGTHQFVVIAPDPRTLN